MKHLRYVRSVFGTIRTSICGWVERVSGRELSVLVKEKFFDLIFRMFSGGQHVHCGWPEHSPNYTRTF